MAWTKVVEQGQFAKSGTTLDDKTATRVFLAISDTNTTCVAAETADDGTTAIPELLSALDGDSTRRLKAISATPSTDGDADPQRVFKVELTYSSKISDDTAAISPLDEPPDISWDFDDATETYFIDKTPEDEDGPFVVVNSAGERFQELLERETGSIVVTITGNIGPISYAPATAITLKDQLNDASIIVDGVTLLAGQAKCKGWTCGGLQERNGVQYRVAKIVLQLKASWNHDVEDRGFNFLGADGKLHEIPKGTPPIKPDTPYPLDGNGVDMDFPDDEPAVLTFKPYGPEPFDGLPFIG